MRATYCTKAQLDQALEEVSRKYDNNIIWNRHPDRGRFTLRVKDSRGKGARLGYNKTSKGNRRHLINACWHVHGDFFDALFNINPEAKVHTRALTITADYGNWRDRNIGGDFQPLNFSDACECNQTSRAREILAVWKSR